MQTDLEILAVRRYRATAHVCPQCQSSFVGILTARYCSSECRQKAAWGRNGESFNAARRASRAAKKAGCDNGSN